MTTANVITSLLRSVYLLMPMSIALSFLWAPPAAILGESSRILYLHVPLAWVSTLAFISAGACSTAFLFGRSGRFRRLDETAHNAAELGLFFALLATATGAVWANAAWGSPWNWDPRELSIAILLLVYIAYISLRASLAGNPSRSRISASYLVIATAAAPFFIFVMPRLYPSLHPDPVINPDRTIHLDVRMKIVLVISMASFTMLYVYLLNLLNRISAIARRREEHP